MEYEIRVVDDKPRQLAATRELVLAVVVFLQGR